MYNPMYSPLREVLNDAAFGKAFDKLAKTIEVRRERSKGRMRKERRNEEEGLRTIALLSIGSPASTVCSSAAWCV